MKKSLAANMVFKLILNIFNICMPLIVSPYILRVVGIQNIGKINYVESIYTYFFAFASIGIYQYGIREVAKLRDNREKLKQFFSSCFIITCISTSIILFIFLMFIYTNKSLNEYKYIFLIYAINIFGNIFYVEWANEGIENYKFITLKTIILRVIYVFGIFIFVKDSDDYLKYVILNSLFIIFNNIISFIFIKRNIGFDFREIKIKKHLKFLMASFIISNAGILLNQVDKTLIGIYGNDISVSLYSVSNMIIFMILTLIQTIVNVSIPRLTNYISNNKNDSYYNLLKSLYDIYCMFTFPIAIGIIILSKEILFLYGGTSYIGATMVLKIFAIYMVALNLEMFIRNQILYVNNREKIITIILSTGGILNVIFTYIGVKYSLFKPEISITITSVIVIIMLVLEIIYIKYRMKFKFTLLSKNIIKYALLSITFIPIDYILRIFLKSTIVITVLITIVCSLFYFLVLIVTKDEYIHKITKNIINR